MSPSKLPKRIALLMITATLCFLLALAASVDSIRRGMDARAVQDSTRLVGNHVKEMQADLAATARDYVFWGAAYGNVMARNFDWIYDNLSSSAVHGELFDGFVLSGGTLPAPVAWVKDGPVTPGPTFLTKAMTMQLATLVAAHDPEEQQAENFIMLVNGQPSLVTALQVRPDDRTGIDPAALPQAIITRQISPDDIEHLSNDMELSEIRFVPAPVPGQPGIPLIGITGMPVAYMTWHPPRPGSELLNAMLPVLAMVVLAFVVAAIAGSLLMRKYAQQLVWNEQAATRLARQDSMTNLPNRLGFVEHLSGIEDAAVGTIALLFMDINGFKKINDTLGHDCGDQVVSDFADRMRGLAGPETYLARVGGDEFVFVVHVEQGLTARLDALIKAIAERMGSPFQFGGTEIGLSLSQGYAIRTEPGLSTRELLRRADLAMYHAKRAGLGMVLEYMPYMGEATLLQVRMAEALRLAVTRPEQFDLLYQPVIDARTGQIWHADAKVRWTSAEFGALEAADFMGVAETTGLIRVLGWLVFDKMLADLVQNPGLRISASFSPFQVAMPKFASDLLGLLEQHRIAPARLVIAVPEPGLAPRADNVARQLDLLHQAGFSSMLDQFGRGTSSIRCLRRLNFGALKLDSSLTGDSVLTLPGSHLVRSIVHFGRSLGENVVCDGIATQAQARAVADIGCDAIQGAHAGPAVPLAEVMAYFPGTSGRNPMVA